MISGQPRKNKPRRSRRGFHSAVLRFLGVHFRIAFGDALTLLFGQFDFVSGVAQHHQTTNA